MDAKIAKIGVKIENVQIDKNISYCFNCDEECQKRLIGKDEAVCIHSVSEKDMEKSIYWTALNRMK